MKRKVIQIKMKPVENIKDIKIMLANIKSKYKGQTEIITSGIGITKNILECWFHNNLGCGYNPATTPEGPNSIQILLTLKSHCRKYLWPLGSVRSH